MQAELCVRAHVVGTPHQTGLVAGVDAPDRVSHLVHRHATSDEYVALPNTGRYPQHLLLGGVPCNPEEIVRCAFAEPTQSQDQLSFIKRFPAARRYYVFRRTRGAHGLVRDRGAAMRAAAAVHAGLLLGNAGQRGGGVLRRRQQRARAVGRAGRKQRGPLVSGQGAVGPGRDRRRGRRQRVRQHCSHTRRQTMSYLPVRSKI